MARALEPTRAEPNEPRAAAELAGAGFVGIVGEVERAHAQIAERWFGLAGRAGAPARRLHDLIAAASYRGVSASGWAAATLASAGLSALAPKLGGARAISESPRGALALSAVNGWLGDRLRGADSDLALAMTVQRSGQAVELEPRALERAFDPRGSKLAIFVHGLMENEGVWAYRSRTPEGARRPTFGARLAADFGFTPVKLRYNTGLRVSANGAELDELLEDLVESWPVEVSEIALVGHSMGGLVARSACHRGAARDARWAGLVRHAIYLGAPHLGAPLERLAANGSWILDALPETRPIARLIRSRSDGIRDLGLGYLLDEHWRDRDRDSLPGEAPEPIPYLPCARHYFIGATLTPGLDDPVSRLIGDLLVVLPSAWAENTHGAPGAWRRYELERSRHVGGLSHFDLASHPRVYEQIETWIAAADARPRLPAPAPA